MVAIPNKSLPSLPEQCQEVSRMMCLYERWYRVQEELRLLPLRIIGLRNFLEQERKKSLLMIEQDVAEIWYVTEEILLLPPRPSVRSGLRKMSADQLCSMLPELFESYSRYVLLDLPEQFPVLSKSHFPGHEEETRALEQLARGLLREIKDFRDILWERGNKLPTSDSKNNNKLWIMQEHAHKFEYIFRTLVDKIREPLLCLHMVPHNPKS